ncbi:MAG: hypothetical protein DRG83_19495 [Deltaproteobacteria bacterium]|nr:MAG: hypothetical protein DRG83_19495 [Deltaproteobacteria bacterium]
MRIGLITTIGTNIGDDFIREGLCLVLSEVFKGQQLKFVMVNKHQPFMVYPRWHPIHWPQMLPRGRNGAKRIIAKLLSGFGLSLFDSCDLIVQCGAPVVWAGCSRCEWAEPLWYQVVGRLSQKGVPVLNLGAGSCYLWEKPPRRVNDERDALYLKKILGYCRITTVRDKVAQRLFESLGQSCPLIPCPALLAGRPFINRPTDEDFVVINYMEKGGHYDWGQNIDPTVWKNTVKVVIERIRKHYQVLFLCHDQKEYRLAFEVNPTIPRVLPKNSQEYFSMLSRVKVGLCNRLHASIALASIGIPSLAVGTDTRLLMVEAVGLPYLYVKEATVERIEEVLQHLLISREKECERLRILREQTWDEYVEVVKKTLCL